VSTVRPTRPAADQGLGPLFTLVVIGLIMATAVLFLRPRSMPALPPAVWGTWITAAPRYADCELRLGSRSVVLRTGTADDDVSIHVIRRVDQTKVPLGTLFTVEYVEGSALDAPVTFEFIYSPSPTPEIMLAHQTEIAWTREQ